MIVNVLIVTVIQSCFLVHTFVFHHPLVDQPSNQRWLLDDMLLSNRDASFSHTVTVLIQQAFLITHLWRGDVT